MYIIIYIYITGFNSTCFVPLGSLTIHDQPVSVPSSNLLAFPMCWQWNFEVLQLPGFLAPVFSTVKPPDFEIYQHSLSMGCGCSSTTVKELVSTFQGFCSCSWFLRDEIARVIPPARHACCHWKKNKIMLMIPTYFTKLRNGQKFLAPVRYEILISFDTFWRRRGNSQASKLAGVWHVGSACATRRDDGLRQLVDLKMKSRRVQKVRLISLYNFQADL